MRPQWEAGVGSGGQVKAAAAFPKENNPSSVFSSFSFAFSHLYFSYTPFHLPASPLILSLVHLSFLSTPPMLITDAWHVCNGHTRDICRPLCVLMCPFITGLNVKSIHGVHLMTTVPVCLCVAVSLYVVKFAVFQHLIVFVCFWVLSLLRRSFWKACVKAVKSLVPQHFCQSTRSHAQTLVLPIKPFSALFHPSATAVLGDTDRERNFRPRRNFVYVCVHGSPQEIGRGCHSRCLCPEQLTTKML